MDDCCSSESSDSKDITRYFDKRVGRYKERSEKGLGDASRMLVDAIGSQGVKGKSLLEIGPGLGNVTFELLRRGAATATGVDLSHEMANNAKKRSEEAGFSDRTNFGYGNAAEASLPKADIVVLDKVICCYPVLKSLLANSISACGTIYGFSVPNDGRIWGAYLRVAFALERLTLWLRRCKAYSYLHPTKLIDQTLAQSGFKQVFQSRTGMWLVRVYAAAG